MGDGYFAGDSSKLEAHKMESEGQWVQWDAIEPLFMIPGLGFQPVVGGNVMVNFVTFEPNTIAPVHWHGEEQVAIVIDGEMEFECGSEKRIVRRGEAVVVPPNVPHGARTYDTTCLAIDVFQPVRQGIVDALAERG